MNDYIKFKYSAMMIQQQVFVLNNIFILLDALSVIFAGYAAVAVQRILSKGAWTIDILPFVQKN